MGVVGGSPASSAGSRPAPISASRSQLAQPRGFPRVTVSLSAGESALGRVIGSLVALAAAKQPPQGAGRPARKVRPFGCRYRIRQRPKLQRRNGRDYLQQIEAGARIPSKRGSQQRLKFGHSLLDRPGLDGSFLIACPCLCRDTLLLSLRASLHQSGP